MRSGWKKFLGPVIGLLVLAAAAGPADAFTYENIGGFTFGTETTTTGGGGGAGKGVAFFGLLVETPPPPFIPGTQYATIGWGNQPVASFTTATDPFTQGGTGPDARSALNFTGISGVINPGDIVPIATLTHANREIFIPVLTAITIDSRLRIFDGIAPIALEAFTPVPIKLTETPNRPTEAECDPATHIGGTSPCSDFFLFPIGVIAPLGFSSGGNSYTVFFDLIPGAGTLFDTVVAECDPSNPGSELCGRVRTRELDINDITLVMGLIQNPRVPAPAALVLLGVALTALGAASQIRRRNRGQ